MKAVVDDQGNVDRGMGALKLAHDPHSLISDIMNAANDLNPSGVVLATKTLQVGVKTRLSAMQRFQYRNKWPTP